MERLCDTDGCGIHYDTSSPGASDKYCPLCKHPEYDFTTDTNSAECKCIYCRAEREREMSTLNDMRTLQEERRANQLLLDEVARLQRQFASLSATAAAHVEILENLKSRATHSELFEDEVKPAMQRVIEDWCIKVAGSTRVCFFCGYVENDSSDAEHDDDCPVIVFRHYLDL